MFHKNIPVVIALVLFPTIVLAEARYDHTHDHLTVNSQNQPLSQVLGEVADATGMKILMDPAVDRPVNFSFSDVPLRVGLKRLTRDMNVVLIEQPGKDGAPATPTLLKLLPAGEGRSDRLQSLGRGDTASKPADDKYYQREQRIDKLPPARREAAQARLDERAADKQARKSERNKDKAAKREQKAAHQAQRDAARMARATRLQTTDPARYNQIMTQIQQRTGHLQQQNNQ